MSDAGELTSPLHYKREFADLYDSISSLDALASLISGKLSERQQTSE